MSDLHFTHILGHLSILSSNDLRYHDGKGAEEDPYEEDVTNGDEMDTELEVEMCSITEVTAPVKLGHQHFRKWSTSSLRGRDK